jgi:hypothetical protein
MISCSRPPGRDVHRFRQRSRGGHAGSAEDVLVNVVVLRHLAHVFDERAEQHEAVVGVLDRGVGVGADQPMVAEVPVGDGELGCYRSALAVGMRC